jgi:hypothetical protein
MQTRGKTDRQAIADNAPWKPAKYEPADAAAIQALVKGAATADQQKRAMNWIVKNCCRTYDLSYRPGEEGRRDTDFAEGRRSVGLQLVMLMNLKIGLITTREG